MGEGLGEGEREKGRKEKGIEEKEERRGEGIMKALVYNCHSGSTQ